MQRSTSMKSMILAVLLGTGCAGTTTTTRTWTVQDGTWARPGVVESIREVDRRVDGHPGAGALLGAVIGGAVTHHLYGAAAGALLGAAASNGSSETRTFEVRVRFDDGAGGTFVYADQTPFAPGEPVVLTPQGLMQR